MKTIVAGSLDRLNQVLYFKCEHCGWIGKAGKHEYTSGTQHNEPYHYVACPCCKNQANWINDGKFLEAVRKLEDYLFNEGV